MALFFKGLAKLENRYASELHKLATPLVEAYKCDYNKGKLGYVYQVPSNTSLPYVNRSFAIAWSHVLKSYDTIAEKKTQFAHYMNDISNDLTNVSAEVEKTQKKVRNLLYI